MARQIIRIVKKYMSFAPNAPFSCFCTQLFGALRSATTPYKIPPLLNKERGAEGGVRLKGNYELVVNYG